MKFQSKDETEREMFTRQFNKFIGWLPWCIALSVGSLALIYILPRADLPFSLDVALWGSVGDFVGGMLNPLFAIFTIILLILSLRLQNLELKDATTQLVLTREVHSQSLLYQDTKNVFEHRAKSFISRMEHRVSKVDPKNPHNNWVSFENPNKQIVMNVPTDDPETNVRFKENIMRFNYDLLDCSSAALALLEMGVQPYLLRETLEELTPSVMKIKRLTEACDCQDIFQEGPARYDELMAESNIRLLVNPF